MFHGKNYIVLSCIYIPLNMTSVHEHKYKQQARSFGYVLVNISLRTTITILEGNSLYLCVFSVIHTQRDIWQQQICASCNCAPLFSQRQQDRRWNADKPSATLDPYIPTWLTTSPANHRPANFWLFDFFFFFTFKGICEKWCNLRSNWWASTSNLKFPFSDSFKYK